MCETCGDLSYPTVRTENSLNRTITCGVEVMSRPRQVEEQPFNPESGAWDSKQVRRDFSSSSYFSLNRSLLPLQMRNTNKCGHSSGHLLYFHAQETRFQHHGTACAKQLGASAPRMQSTPEQSSLGYHTWGRAKGMGVNCSKAQRAPQSSCFKHFHETIRAGGIQLKSSVLSQIARIRGVGLSNHHFGQAHIGQLHQSALVPGYGGNVERCPRTMIGPYQFPTHVNRSTKFYK